MRIMFFIGTVDLILSLIGYFYYRKNLPWGKHKAFALAYALLTLNAIASRPLSPLLPAGIVKISAWLEGLWVAFGYYTVLFALVHSVMYIIIYLLRHLIAPSDYVAQVAHFYKLRDKFAAFTLACTLILVTWGSYRAFHPVVRTERIETTKLASGVSYKMALISDVHLGRSLGRSYAERLTQRLNTLAPDLVLIAGDLVDEKIAYVEEENSLDALKLINAPKGVYVAFGNHEYIDNPSKWQQLVEKQGFTVLRDKSIILEDRLKISGLNDFSRNRDTRTLVELALGNDKYYSILLDHQPRKMEAAADASYDLYLSGHTHTGQLFPNRQITQRMYQLDYGRTKKGQLTAITSSGYGFWGPPVRTEAAPEIVLIELIGK